MQRVVQAGRDRFGAPARFQVRRTTPFSTDRCHRPCVVSVRSIKRQPCSPATHWVPSFFCFLFFFCFFFFYCSRCGAAAHPPSLTTTSGHVPLSHRLPTRLSIPLTHEPALQPCYTYTYAPPVTSCPPSSRRWPCHDMLTRARTRRVVRIGPWQHESCCTTHTVQESWTKTPSRAVVHVDS